MDFHYKHCCKVGELDNIGNLGTQLSFEQRETLIYFEEIVSGQCGGIWGDDSEGDDNNNHIGDDRKKHKKRRERKTSDKTATSNRNEERQTGRSR